MKKILFIHHATGWTGAAINMINIINGLDRTKYITNVLLLRDSIVSKMLTENNIQYTIAKSAFYKKYYSYFIHSDASNLKWFRLDIVLKQTLSWILSRFYYASCELKRLEYDIVHLNSSVLTDWLAPSKGKGKVIIHIQEPFSKGNWGLRHYILTSQMRKYADQIIAISKDNARRINVQEKTKVVYNFIKINEEDDIDNRNSESGKVLYVGGSEMIKGYFTVVDSLDYLDHDIKLVFCGNYATVDNKSGLFGIIKNIIRSILPVHKKLKAALIKIKNHPNAVFVGLVNNTTIMIQESEFLISPFSKPHFSRPVFEAFANKRCVIGSDVEGMDEIIDHRMNGLIIEKNSPVKLAEAINYLHANFEIRNEMAENGYTKAKGLFSSSNILQIQNIYDDLFLS